MNLRRSITTFAGATALLGLVALSGPAVWAQEATPAAEATVPRPAHIHSGNCNDLGEVVYPLTDLVSPTGESVGQSRRASVAQTSYTTVPATLDALLGQDYAINVHLSAEQIGTYIACGEIGGILTPNGALAIGLHEVDDSGFAGIAYLSPSADGASTDVSVFVAPLERARQGGGSAAQAQATTAPQAQPTVETLPVETAPAGTPVASTGGGTLEASGQVPVSLSEFRIDMPTEIAAGTVTFAITNDGTVKHGFEIEGQGIDEQLQPRLQPGETGMLTVDLTPGTYDVYCPVDAHADQGMRTEITVS
jgi:plastocyanin